MLLPRHAMMDRFELDRRQSQAPCPQGNGTTVGSDQEYTLLCNLLVDGDVMDRPDAFDFAACLNLCSSFHPKCEAISFNANRCLLKNNLQLGSSRTARRFDSAIARFPGASSNCPTVGSTQLIAGNTTFGIMCGNIVAGFDIAQKFAPTFQDCMGQCAFTPGCGGVSFDASQNQGFKNCYMKTTVTNSSAIFRDQNIDSALIATIAAANPAASGSATPAPPAALPTTTAGPGVATIPLSQIQTTGGGGGGGGAVFFTPPGETVGVPIPISSAASVNPANTVVPPPETTLDPDISGEFPQSDTPPPDVPFTQGLTQSGDISTIATAAPDSAGNNNSDSGMSNAWIAAPVVGSIAALVLIVLSFIMIKRRRRNNGSESPLGGKTPTISRPSPVSSLFTTWLPSSQGRNSRASRGSKMGNFSEVTGAQTQMSGAAGAGGGNNNLGLASKLGMRGSIVGFFRPGGSSMSGMERLDDIEETGAVAAEKNRGVSSGGESTSDNRESTPVYGLKEGKMELRNSMNGLGQNRWS